MNPPTYPKLAPFLKNLGFPSEEVEFNDVDETHGRRLEEMVESFLCRIPKETDSKFLERAIKLHYGAEGFTHDRYRSKERKGNIRLLSEESEIDVWVEKYTEEEKLFTVYMFDKI